MVITTTDQLPDLILEDGDLIAVGDLETLEQGAEFLTGRAGVLDPGPAKRNGVFTDRLHHIRAWRVR
jgi:hypothetical protein